MKLLIERIKNLKRSSEIRKLVDKRIKEFKNLGKSEKYCFSELCFCLLTSNSKAETALRIQKELGANGFYLFEENEISECIKKNKHRFHNIKAHYIVEARKYKNIKSKIKSLVKEKSEVGAREWLFKNIKGFGYKEASHFLRNIGYKNIAIIDRHILSLLFDYGIIKKKPKAHNKKNYLEIEKILKKIAEKTNLNLAKLDLYMWYMKTGRILK